MSPIALCAQEGSGSKSVDFEVSETSYLQVEDKDRFPLMISEGKDGFKPGDLFIVRNAKKELAHPLCVDALERIYVLSPSGSSPDPLITLFLDRQKTLRANRARELASNESSTWLAGNCLSCHVGKPAEPFPSYIYDLQYWQQVLEAKDARANKEARDWLNRFERVLVSTPSMPPSTSKEARHFESSNQKRRVLAFIEHNADKLASGAVTLRKQARTEDQQQRVTDPLILVESQYKEDLIKITRQIRSDDFFLVELLNTFDILYDKVGVPDASQAPNLQNGGTISLGVRPLSYPVSNRDVVGKVVDENDRWLAPFNTGFGIEKDTSPVGSYFLMRLPQKEKGAPDEREPIATYSEQFYSINSLSGISQNHADPDTTQSWRWIYPVGTVATEILFRNVKASDDGVSRSFVFEVRTREKVKMTDETTWRGEAYRSFPTPESLLEAVKTMPQWQENPGLKDIVTRIEAGDIGKEVALENHFGSIFMSLSIF